MTAGLNNDFSKRVVLRTEEMDWQPSPSPSVWRKRLDLAGDVEASRVTSVVRYDPRSHFHAHPHPDGEEILVLSGVFSDEQGDHAAGSYLLNPEGFSHAPFSDEGCVLFVKLRQYRGLDRAQIKVDTAARHFSPASATGVETMQLYSEPEHPEQVDLVRLAAGGSLPAASHPGGAEIFVLEGQIEEGDAVYDKGAWLRFPAGPRPALASGPGCRFYFKRDHLPPLGA
ncbi:MAG TPA: cupin domain-containing protein [Kiloniellaceae bacterium]|nr:cupin domain-containing protein [Kiloniellaceae bacterium]